jgi:uncharacterized protein YciI
MRGFREHQVQCAFAKARTTKAYKSIAEANRDLSKSVELKWLQKARGGMPYFALIYELVDDYLVRRAAFRQEHLGLAAAARERGEIVLAGAFADPADRALLVFRVADRAVAESFAQKDPYVVNGLVKRWEVRPWNVVIGGDD